MGFVDEFKTFIARGNVLDMSIGVIIGGAFGKIVSSLTDDILMPPIGALMGKLDFSELHFPIINDPSKYDASILEKFGSLMHTPVDKVRAMGIPTIAYGNFINQVINFLIVAFCIFLLIKVVNSFTKKKEEDAAAAEKAEPTTKVCPECLSEIPIKAHRCKFCTAVLEEKQEA
ncbi:large conductance mechanosensitive channel protein MscL [bacterium]|nr:large conductance mechanosensitive channel protein MscL [bacterium]